jgi:hypothetical protein
MIRWSCLALTVAVLANARGADPAAPVRYEQVRIGKAVVSLPSHWTTGGSESATWLHLHGAPGVMETHFAAMGAPGILINVTLPGLSKVYADHFADPQVFPQLLRDTEAVLRRAEPSRAWRIGRLTVSSFSAGFGGVRQLLRQPDALARIDAIVMADSIYCGYAGDPAQKIVDEELMAGFLRFARLAREGTKRFVLSHSEQVPEGYASTTETADYLIRQLGGQRRTLDAGLWPAGLRLRSGYSVSGFRVLGFEGAAPENHMRHLRGIGAFLALAQEM